MKTRNCEGCKALFKPKNKLHRFCSKACCSKAWFKRRQKPCPQCSSPMYHGSKKCFTCTDYMTESYLGLSKILSLDLSRFKIYKYGKYLGIYYLGKKHTLHRLVWIQNNMRMIKLGFVIDHLNEDKYDNRPENLDECTQTENIRRFNQHPNRFLERFNEV